MPKSGVCVRHSDLTTGIVRPSQTLSLKPRLRRRAYCRPVVDKRCSIPSDSVMLLLDHQSGLFQTVKDVALVELRANVTMLAKLAALLKISVITTASEPDGPNGPLMPEIHQVAPHAVYVPRKGEVNAWDNEDFVKIVRATGRKTLIMAGVWTSVCVMFPALDAKAAGFKVYTVMDASGDPSEMASRTTLARFTQAASSRLRQTRCCPKRIAPGIAPKPPSSRSSTLWRLRITPRWSRAIRKRKRSRNRRK